MKTYTNSEKIAFLNQMEAALNRSNPMKRLKRFPSFIRNLLQFTKKHDVVHDSYVVLAILNLIVFYFFKSLEVSVAIGSAVYLFIITIMERIGSDVQYFDSVIQGISDMRDSVSQSLDVSFLERTENISVLIDYFTDTYVKNDALGKDKRIFAQILRDVSNELYRLGKIHLELEKCTREQFGECKISADSKGYGYTYAEKIDLLKRVQESFKNSKKMKQLTRFPKCILDSFSRDNFFVKMVVLPIFITTGIVFALVQFGNIASCFASLPVSVSYVFYILAAICAINCFLYLVSLVVIADIFNYCDSVLQDLSDMKDVIMKRYDPDLQHVVWDENNPVFHPCYFFDGHDDCEAAIQYFRESYSVKYPSDTDQLIFAQILQDVSEELYRLDMEQLEYEKSKRDQVIIDMETMC